MKKNKNMFGITCFLPKIVLLLSFTLSFGGFIACNKVDDDALPQYLLSVERIEGEGFATAAWKSGSATWVNLVAGVKINQGLDVTLTAEPRNPAHTAVWNGTVIGTRMVTSMKDKDQKISVAFQPSPPVNYALKISPHDAVRVYLDKDYNLEITEYDQIREDARLYLDILKVKDQQIHSVDGIDPGSLSEDKTKAYITMTSDKTVTVTYIDITYHKLKLHPSVTAFIDDERQKPIQDLNKIEFGTKIYLTISVDDDETKIVDVPGVNDLNQDKTRGTIIMTEDKEIIPVLETNPDLFETQDMDDGNYVSVIKYRGNKSTVGIPAFLKNIAGESVPVRGVGDINGTWLQPVFNDNLVSVTLPTGITNIGRQAFDGCRNMTSFNIPSTVTIIGDNAFRGCQLSSIDIPVSVTEISANAFEGCLFSEITLPENLSTLGQDVFMSCPNLRTITMPGVGEISSVLNGTLNITLNIIGEKSPGRFQNCTSLVEIVIAKTVPVQGENREMFEGCLNLKKITMPMPSFSSSNMGHVLKGLADGQIELTFNNDPIEMPSFGGGKDDESDETGQGSGGRALKKLTMPASIQRCGSGIFSTAFNLEELIMLGTTPPTVDAQAFSGLTNSELKIYVPKGSLNSYASDKKPEDEGCSGEGEGDCFMVGWYQLEGKFVEY
ncbi:MAG: leucine-rich repeat domain-containing protein [Bacteroidales bacterium]